MNSNKYIKIQKAIDNFGKTIMDIMAEGEEAPKFDESVRSMKQEEPEEFPDELRRRIARDNEKFLMRRRRRPKEEYGDVLAPGPAGYPERIDVGAALREARRLTRLPWVRFSDQRPTKEDKDEDGFVIVRCGRTILTEKFRVTNYKFAPYVKDAYEWARIRDVVKR